MGELQDKNTKNYILAKQFKKNLWKINNLKHISQIKNLAFVPTMGTLHRGHISLIKEAKKKSLTVGVRDNPVNFLGVELIDDNKRPNPCVVSKGCRCGLKKSVVVVCARCARVQLRDF